MSSTQTRELTVSNGSGSRYFTASGVTLDGTVSSFKYAAGVAAGGSGTATYNSAAKDILFPNATAHPTQMVISYWDGAVGIGSPSAQFAVGGTQLINQSMSTSKNNRSFTKTDTAVRNATKSTALVWTLKGATLAGGGIGDVKLSLSFTRYDFSAAKGEGIASASVSSANGYDGDSITFTATPADGYSFDHWSDGSTDNPHTITVSGADKALTAYGAALEQTNLYVKDSGAWKRIKAAYKKISGAYVMQTDIPSLFPTGVKLMRGESPEPTGDYTLLSHISTTNGAAYINTGANPDNPTIEYQSFGVQMGDSNTAWLIGSYETSHYFAVGDNTHYATAYMSGNDTSSISTLVQDNDVVRISASGVTVNGVTIKTFSGTYSKSSRNFLLFGASRNGTPYNPQRIGKMSLRYCKIWDGNTLVRDFVPAMRNSDHAVGLLDQVNNEFYASATSTPFLAGDPI